MSHTRDCSVFKIGSHHYANNLEKIGYNITYMGIPHSLIHKVIRGKSQGTNKLNNSIINFNPFVIFPMTMHYNKIVNFVNFMTIYLSKKSILKKEFDVIICDYPFFVPLLKKINYKKLIYRPTDNYEEMSGQKVTKYEKEMCSIASGIISTSDKVSNDLSNKYKINSSKLYVIPNGFDDEFFYTDCNVSRNGIVYVGAIDNRFDFDAVNYLASKIDDINIDIYGPVNNEFREEILEISSKGKVNLKGVIEYNNLKDILNHYRVGILPLNSHPSNKGRSPMKLWEYISCGLRVIYSEIEDIEEIDGVYKYTGLEDFVEKVRKALDDETPLPNYILKDKTWRNKTKILSGIISNLPEN